MDGNNCANLQTTVMVLISGIHPYPISAVETNQNGYTVKICLRCIIDKPDGNQLTFTNPNIVTISGVPLDCSTSLSDASFSNPAAIPFNGKKISSFASVTTDYRDIFTHA